MNFLLQAENDDTSAISYVQIAQCIQQTPLTENAVDQDISGSYTQQMVSKC